MLHLHISYCEIVYIPTFAQPVKSPPATSMSTASGRSRDRHSIGNPPPLSPQDDSASDMSQSSIDQVDKQIGTGAGGKPSPTRKGTKRSPDPDAFQPIAKAGRQLRSHRKPAESAQTPAGPMRGRGRGSSQVNAGKRPRIIPDDDDDMDSDYAGVVPAKTAKPGKGVAKQGKGVAKRGKGEAEVKDDIVMEEEGVDQGKAQGKGKGNTDKADDADAEGETDNEVDIRAGSEDLDIMAWESGETDGEEDEDEDKMAANPDDKQEGDEDQEGSEVELDGGVGSIPTIYGAH